MHTAPPIDPGLEEIRQVFNGGPRELRPRWWDEAVPPGVSTFGSDADARTWSATVGCQLPVPLHPDSWARAARYLTPPARLSEPITVYDGANGTLHLDEHCLARTVGGVVGTPGTAALPGVAQDRLVGALMRGGCALFRCGELASALFDAAGLWRSAAEAVAMCERTAAVGHHDLLLTTLFADVVAVEAVRRDPAGLAAPHLDTHLIAAVDNALAAAHLRLNSLAPPAPLTEGQVVLLDLSTTRPGLNACLALAARSVHQRDSRLGECVCITSHADAHHGVRLRGRRLPPRRTVDVFFELRRDGWPAPDAWDAALSAQR